MSTTARPTPLPRDDARPADQRKTALQTLLRDVAHDARQSPTAYLHDTRVPGGGE